MKSKNIMCGKWTPDCNYLHKFRYFRSKSHDSDFRTVLTHGNKTSTEIKVDRKKLIKKRQLCIFCSLTSVWDLRTKFVRILTETYKLGMDRIECRGLFSNSTMVLGCSVFLTSMTVSCPFTPPRTIVLSSIQERAERPTPHGSARPVSIQMTLINHQD